MQDETIELLKQCESGVKMAVSSIDEVLDNVKNNRFKEMLIDFKNKHLKIEKEIHNLLKQYNENDKEPNPVAKSMSWIKINVKITIDDSDQTIADLMTDGCNMGIKTLSKYLNKLLNADETSRKICEHLIYIEDNFANSIRCYL